MPLTKEQEKQVKDLLITTWDRICYDFLVTMPKQQCSQKTAHDTVYDYVNSFTNPKAYALWAKLPMVDQERLLRDALPGKKYRI